MKPGFIPSVRETIRLTRKYFKQILIITIVNAVLLYLITLLIVWSSNLHIPINPILLLIIISVIETTIHLFNFSLIILFIVSYETFQSNSVQKNIQYILHRLPFLLITYYIYGLFILIGLILLAIPGLIIMVTFSQCLNFALIEGLNPIAAFKNSAKITKGNKLQLMGIWLLFGIIFGIPFEIFTQLKLPSVVNIYVTFLFINIVAIFDYVLWKTMKQIPLQGSSSHKNNKLIVFILLAIILIIVAILGLNFYHRNSSFYNQSISPTIVPANNLESWKTYINKKYVYSVEYPSNYTYFSNIGDPNLNVQLSPDITISAAYGNFITIKAGLIKEKTVSLEEFVQQELNKDPTNEFSIVKATAVNGYKAIYIGNNSQTKTFQPGVYIAKDDSQIILIKLGISPNSSIQESTSFFYRIVSSVKFTNN